MDRKFLGRIGELSKEEHLGRSTAMRILLEEGYRSYAKRKAAQDYMAGKTTISGAALKADVTVWEMEQYLVSAGFKSQYSAEDLKEEAERAGAR